MSEPTTPSEPRNRHVHLPIAHPGPGSARLAFDNGMERFTIQTDGHLDGLFEARFAEPLPVVWAVYNTVHVDYPLGSRLLRRGSPSAVRLNPVLPWSLDVHGGAAHIHADLTGARIEAVSFHSGLARSRFILGRPAGEVTIRLSSVKDLRVERPGDTPVRVRLSPGATNITIDEARHPASGAGLDEATAGYDTAGDRYLVIATAGVDELTVGASL